MKGRPNDLFTIKADDSWIGNKQVIRVEDINYYWDFERFLQEKEFFKLMDDKLKDYER